MKTPIEQLQRIAIIATSMAWSGNVGSGAFTSTNALTFNFTPTTGTSQQAIDRFAQAGSLSIEAFHPHLRTHKLKGDLQDFLGTYKSRLNI